MELIRRARRKRLAAALAAALAFVAGCGGGDLHEPFAPTRQLSFGDEISVIESDGRNYGINGRDANGNFNCTVHPNWVQYLAGSFGFVFAQCNPNNAAPRATLYAQRGAKVADLSAQIDAHLATGTGFGSRDMVTVLMGANDVLEQYALYSGAASEAALLAELRRRGELLADQINRIVGLGGRVIVATVPDIGLSPFAIAERNANTDTDRAALISRFVFELNRAMRFRIINDGHFIGLVTADELTQGIVRAPVNFGFSDVTQAACLQTSAPPACTTATLVSGATATGWMWASGPYLSAGGQLKIGESAVTRARNNPL